MKRSNELDNILDECLERMFAGESIEACLDSYPEHAAELAPLLQTVAGTREAVDIKPRPEFRQQAANDFQAAIRDMTPVGRKAYSGLRHWWVSAVAALAVIVVAGGSTVAASSGSMPDGLLYPVKTATENVRLALAFSPESKAELYAQFADRRVDEIVAMAGAGNIREIENITGKLNNQLVAMVEVFGADNQACSAVGDASRNNDSMLSYHTESAEGQTAPVPALTSTATTTVASTQVVPGETQVTMAQTETKGFGVDIQDEEEGFRESLMEASMSNSVKLWDAMNEANDPVKEALERALEVANQAYAYAISNIR